MFIELEDDSLIVNTEAPYVILTKEAFEWLIARMQEQSDEIDRLTSPGIEG